MITVEMNEKLTLTSKILKESMVPLQVVLALSDSYVLTDVMLRLIRDINTSASTALDISLSDYK